MLGDSKTPKIVIWVENTPEFSCKTSRSAARRPHNATIGQWDAHFPAHLQAPERGQSAYATHMDQTRGFHALDRQAASTSSPRARPQSHIVGCAHIRQHPHTFRSVCAQTALTACAGATGDRKVSHRSSAPCRRFSSATHRHLVSPGSPSCLVKPPPTWP